MTDTDTVLLVLCGAGLLGGGMALVAVIGSGAKVGAWLVRLRRHRPPGRHRH